jgi:hypothetical protein
MKNPIYISSILLLAFTSCIAPRKDFEKYNPPAKPDYALQQNWAALPDKKDTADVVPKKSTLTDNQATAVVDVFFIHPTTYIKKKSWNADVGNEKLNRLTDKTTIFNQASVFNGSCKIYAPRYRQATLYSFIDKKSDNGKKALDLAYVDVKNAFEYYLKNYNNGRPIIIASHSQGSYHAFLLMKDYFENNPALYKQLVCAYLIGMATEITYQQVTPCDSSNQTGCMVGWRTAKWGKEPDETFFTPTTFCTNPLSWKNDTIYVGKEKNIGGSPFGLKRIDNEICDAQVQRNILWVHKPKKCGYFPLAKNYHMADYNLFYMNIRDNVKLRIAQHIKQNN